MQVGSIDSVDVIFTIFFPPIAAAMAYGAGYAAARAVNRGTSFSAPTKTALRYGPLFILGMLYLICVFEMFKLPGLAMWVFVIAWGIVVIWLARRRKRGENEGI